MLSPPVLPFGPSQEPTDAEWLRPRKPDGSPYVRGKHGGWDFQGDIARSVQSGIVKYVNFGPSLGRHQFVLKDSGGSGGWFYAHTSSRPPEGLWVDAGAYVARISDEGVPGQVHLHLEYLSDFTNWYSTKNRTNDLHETWEAENMALSDEDKDWIERALNVRIQALGAALFDGTNNPESPIIPDSPGWKERLKNNLKSIKAATSGGVDPAVIEAALRKVLKEGTG